MSELQNLALLGWGLMFACLFVLLCTARRRDALEADNRRLRSENASLNLSRNYWIRAAANRTPPADY